MFSFMCGNSVFYSVLAMGDKSDMGRYFVPMLGSLFGFEIEMICIKLKSTIKNHTNNNLFRLQLVRL